jgi:hypothetical protein
MTVFERTELLATTFKSLLIASSLIGGAVLLSMAYQSWEYGVGMASLVFFHRMAK